MAKVAVVVGKSKKKSIKKKVPATKPSKFISQGLTNKKANSKKRKRPKTKGLVYVKNLPYGFFEEQLRGYFSQFGAVTRVRLGRSPKTLNSRGYAFIEFRYPEVAEIAAQTMNNYIMFHRIVKAKYIPPNEIHHDYFRSKIVTIKQNGEKVLTSKSIIARKMNVENINRLMTDEDQKMRIEKVRTKVSKQKARLASLGIDFDVDMVASNMGEEVIKPIEKKKELTIENLEEEDLDGEADETFDPAKFDIDSSDEFQDFDYDSDESVDEDEIAELSKKQKAIDVAKKVSDKKAKEKDNKEILKTKTKANDQPSKKPKMVKKEAEVKKKPAAKLKETKVVAEKVPQVIERAVTRGKAKAASQPAKPEKAVSKLKEKKSLVAQKKVDVAEKKTAAASKKVKLTAAKESPPKTKTKVVKKKVGK